MTINDSQAVWYAEAYSKNSQPQQKFSTQLIQEIAHSPNIKHIWDVGCGSGNNIQPLLDNFPDASLVGNDPSDSMYEYAIKRFSENTNVKLYHESAQDFQPPHSVDLVFSAYVLHWIPTDDLAPLFAKIYRSLNPNGIFVARTVCLNHFKHLDAILTRLRENKKYRANLAEFESSHFINRIGDYETSLIESGFIIEELSINRKSVNFKDREALKAFIKQWLEGAKFIAKTNPTLAESYLDDFAQGYLDASHQMHASPLRWDEAQLTIIAKKT